MAPLNKRARLHGDLNEHGLSPATVFKSPGLEPDVRFNIFEHDIHVHSIILKLHSSYFRTFLDGPDKLPPNPSTATSFKYEYVAVIDEDGAWGLEAASKACSCYDLLSYTSCSN